MTKPKSGNRTARRYHPPPRKVVIPTDLAKLVRTISPDIQLQQLVEMLLAHWIADVEAKKKPPIS